MPCGTLIPPDHEDTGICRRCLQVIDLDAGGRLIQHRERLLTGGTCTGSGQPPWERQG